MRFSIPLVPSRVTMGIMTDSGTAPQTQTTQSADTPAVPLHTQAPQAQQLPQYDLFTRVMGVGSRVLTSLPAPLLKLAGGRKNKDGNILDADVAATLRALSLIHGKQYWDVSIAEARQMIDDEAFMGGGKPPTVGSVTEHYVRGVRVRHYRPSGAESPERALPTVVYFHGGGWTLGSLDSHDSTCRWLCNRAEVAVISVDYRLAPEHPFPAGFDDAHAVTDAALTEGEIAGVDAQRVAVAGDSAGGNLATAVCLRRRDEKKPQPALQVLIVPVTSLAKPRTQSYHEFSQGLFLTADQMDWYEKQYVQRADDVHSPYVSPLMADDVSGLAPAYIAVAGFDPLRDEGELYAKKLGEQGVAVTLRRHAGLVHPFANSTGIWANARRAMDEVVGAVRLALRV